MAPAVGKTHAGPLNAYDRGAYMLNAVLLDASELKASEPQSMCASMWALRRSPGMLIFVRVNQSWAMHLLAHQDESLRRGRAPLTNLIVARASLTPMNCKIGLMWD